MVSEGARTPAVWQQEGLLATMALVAAEVCWEVVGQGVDAAHLTGVVPQQSAESLCDSSCVQVSLLLLVAADMHLA